MYEPNCRNTMKHRLRRTLVLWEVHYPWTIAYGPYNFLSYKCATQGTMICVPAVGFLMMVTGTYYYAVTAVRERLHLF